MCELKTTLEYENGLLNATVITIWAVLYKAVHFLANQIMRKQVHGNCCFRRIFGVDILLEYKVLFASRPNVTKKWKSVDVSLFNISTMNPA